MVKPTPLVGWLDTHWLDVPDCSVGRLVGVSGRMSVCPVGVGSVRFVMFRPVYTVVLDRFSTLCSLLTVPARLQPVSTLYDLVSGRPCTRGTPYQFRPDCG